METINKMAWSFRCNFGNPFQSIQAIKNNEAMQALINIRLKGENPVSAILVATNESPQKTSERLTAI